MDLSDVELIDYSEPSNDVTDDDQAPFPVFPLTGGRYQRRFSAKQCCSRPAVQGRDTGVGKTSNFPPPGPSITATEETRVQTRKRARIESDQSDVELTDYSEPSNDEVANDDQGLPPSPPPDQGSLPASASQLPNPVPP